NSPLLNQEGSTGGVFAPGGSAVLIRHFGSDNSGILNYGTMIGEGTWRDPVLDIQTRYSISGGGNIDQVGDGDTENGGNHTFVWNMESYDEDAETWQTGVIGSKNTPWAWSRFDATYLADLGFAMQDLNNGFSWGDFAYDFLDPEEGLARFSNAANDILA